jgi:hypothetical protein
MPDRAVVTFSKQKLIRFENEYNEAVKEKCDAFEFDGNTYMVGYAKHLIAYLKTKF